MYNIDLPGHFKSSVTNNEATRRGFLEKADRISTKIVDTEEVRDAIIDQMGWRERYLPAFLAALCGGNTALIYEKRDADKAVKALEDEKSDQLQSAQRIDQTIKDDILEYLKGADLQISSILVPLSAAEALTEAADQMANRIQGALSSINSAQSMETMDLFTKNKGISLMSTFSNASARDAINGVKADAEAFEQTVNQYSKTLKDFELDSIQTSSNDMIDLTFDFFFDGFDFMSIFTLSALGSAEDSLENAQQQVSKIKDMAQDHESQLQAKLDEKIEAIRQTCQIH